MVTAGERAGTVRFAVGTDCLSTEAAAPYLPRREDESFDGYGARLRAALAGRPYTLQVNHLEEHGWPVWRFGRDFLTELFEQVGL